MATKISDLQLYRNIAFVLRDKKINPEWKNMGELLNALESYEGQYDNELIFLCQLMNLTSDTNRSTFIKAFFEYHKLPFIPYKNGSTYNNGIDLQPTGYSANGHAILRRGNKQRKPKAR